MSSINNFNRKNLSGSVTDDDNSNLSKTAKAEGLFQNDPVSQDNAQSTDGDTSTKSTKVGKHSRTASKAASANFLSSQSSTKTSTGTQTVLPSSSDASGTPSTSDAADVDALATGQTSEDAVSDATTQLTTDLADSTTSKTQFEQDVQGLSTALTQAGIQTPVSTVINDLVDPSGKGTTAPTALTAAAKAQGVDLSVDDTDVQTAQATLQAAVNQSPVVQAAVDVASAHLARVSTLAGQQPATVFGDVATATSSSNAGGLAALYAAAAKNGVDLSDKGDDAISNAKNTKATKAASDQRQQAQAAYAQQQQAAASASSGTSSSDTGATGSVSYSGGTASNTQTYSSIAKTGSGTSAGGWDTTGNAAIAPNPDNPVNFETTYGIKGGFTSESLDDLLAKVPQLTSQYPNIKSILTTAAASVSPAIPPQLLLSTLGVETSFATNYGNNAKDGPFQFIASTFAEYGTGDRTNMTDAANAAAKYYSTLLKANGNDLFAAMRDYNGDVNEGASNTYQKDQQSIFNGDVDL